MLEAVQRLAENPKLEPGDYSALMRAILKVKKTPKQLDDILF